MHEAVNFEQAETLSESQKVALRLHRAFLTYPSGARDELRGQVLEHYTPTQIVELAFKYVYWSSNRATVLLGGDAPHDPDRIASFHYDENGLYVPHTPRVAT
jgi:hypothetical protein